MTTPVLESLDIQYIDHLAITTNDLPGTLEAYMRLPGTRLVRGPGDNPTQGVQYAFIRLADGWRLEILAPLPEVRSPISTHLAGGGGPYHFCYAVKAIEDSISAAVGHGAKLVVEPVEDIAFDGRRVAFLYHALTGLFELVEALAPTSARMQAAADSASARPAKAPLRQEAARHSSPGDLDERLAATITGLFPNIPAAAIRSLKLNSIPEWNSLGHLMLMMQIERDFDVVIASEAVAKLDSFAAIRGLLEELI